MIFLKVIPYANHTGLEATWYTKAADARGGEFEQQVFCQSFDQTQMGLFRAKAGQYGTSLDEHEALITDIEANGPPLATSANKQDLAVSIDDAVAAIYARHLRFQAEYAEREAQAQSFKDAGYTGDVPVQVAAFAAPARKTGQEAADIILAQAAQLRGALSQLGVLRMRKYEVLSAPDVAAAQVVADGILGAVNQIGAAL